MLFNLNFLGNKTIFYKKNVTLSKIFIQVPNFTNYSKMKILAFLLILLAIDLPDVNRIAKINQLKEEAVSAYKNKRYAVAINRYETLLNEFGEKDEKLQLNLAHAYYQQAPDTNATKQYEKLKFAADKYIRSVAEQQLGNICMKKQPLSAEQLKEALEHYKNALKADSQNESARTNYEMVKKMLDQKNKQDQQNKEQQNQNKDKKDEQKEQEEKENKQDNKQDSKQQKQEQEKKEQEKKEQQEKKEKEEQEKKEQQKKEQEKKQKEAQGGEKKDSNGDKKQAERDDESKDKGKEKEQQQSKLRSERLQQMNMTENQAKMVLDAMKSTEVQYLQQSQKRASKKSDKTKPDW